VDPLILASRVSFLHAPRSHPMDCVKAKEVHYTPQEFPVLFDIDTVLIAKAKVASSFHDLSY